MQIARSRYIAAIDPQLRQIREGIGLSFDYAAGLVHEGRHLLHTQEAGPADPAFVWSTTAKYIAHAVGEARAGRYPTMNDIRGATRIDWVRRGLGLSPADCARILRISADQTSVLFDGRRPWPEPMRRAAWLSLVDWGGRRMRRIETRRRIVENLAAERRSVAGFTPEQLAVLELEAASGKRSKTQVEADVLRVLGAAARARRS